VNSTGKRSCAASLKAKLSAASLGKVVHPIVMHLSSLEVASNTAWKHAVGGLLSLMLLLDCYHIKQSVLLVVCRVIKLAGQSS